jgi:hypothetical protein
MSYRPIEQRSSVTPSRCGRAPVWTLVAFLIGSYQTARGADGCPMHDGVSLDGQTTVVVAQLPAGGDHDGMHHGASHGGPIAGAQSASHDGDHGGAAHGPCGCVGHCSVLGGPAIVAPPAALIAFSAGVASAPLRSSARVAHRDARQGHAYLPNAPPIAA